MPTQVEPRALRLGDVTALLSDYRSLSPPSLAANDRCRCFGLRCPMNELWTGPMLAVSSLFPLLHHAYGCLLCRIRCSASKDFVVAITPPYQEVDVIPPPPPPPPHPPSCGVLLLGRWAYLRMGFCPLFALSALRITTNCSCVSCAALPQGLMRFSRPLRSGWSTRDVSCTSRPRSCECPTC